MSLEAAKGRESVFPVVKDALAMISDRVQKTSLFSRIKDKQGELPKYTKAQAYYVPRSVTSAQCSNCPWFQPAEGNGPSTCLIVDENDNPTPGEISPNGICALYFSAVLRSKLYGVAYGRGVGNTGVLPQIVRSRIIKRRLSGYSNESG